MKYLVIFILIIVSIAHANSIVNNSTKVSLRKGDIITTTSVETSLPNAPTVTTQEITTTLHPETTTTVIQQPVTTVVSTALAPETNEVSTLVELPIDYHTSISYYYPYFYKTHLITFADEVDTSVLVTTCSPSSHCAYCDPLNFEHCSRCDIGYFLNGFGCESFCPEGYISDILRLKCVPTLTTGKIYLM